MTATIHSRLRLRSGAVLQNRIAKAAMSERLATPDRAPSHGLRELYRRWATSGAGLLITGNVMVDRRAIGETGNVVVEDGRDLAALESWAAAARLGEARVWMQINHPGRQAPRFANREAVAPSAVAMRGGAGAFAKPRALAEAEIEQIIARFARTAAIARSAGFDGVQIHAAHGYLISQFLSPLTNRRADGWGGTPEKRRRFLLEIVRAVRAAVGNDFSLSVKLNSADFQRGGFDETESMAVVEALEAEGIDLLEVSGGTYESAAMFEETVPEHASSHEREAFFLDYAARVRSRVALPLMVTGGFRTAAGMNHAIASGAADLVGLGRPLAVEPDLPARLLSGRTPAAAPVKLRTGNKKVDALVQAAWHQAQIVRMASGLAPDPTLGRIRAVVSYAMPRRPRTSAPIAGLAPNTAMHAA